MPTEYGTNYPNVLGKLNFPGMIVRSGPIGNQAMAMGRGENPVHLAQILNGARVRELITVRPMPLMDRVRAMRARGGLLKQTIDSLGRTIPQPYPRYMWAPGMNLANVPSVISDIQGASGPRRTVLPQKHNFSVII